AGRGRTDSRDHLPENAIVAVTHRRRRGMPDHPFARFLTRRWVGAEVLSSLDALAHPRHRRGHGIGIARPCDLSGGGGSDDVRRLAGDDAEDGNLSGHERIELRRHRAFVGFEWTETDESGI